jgi:hypothetical protein
LMRRGQESGSPVVTGTSESFRILDSIRIPPSAG